MAGALPRNGGNKSANRVGPTVSRRLRAAGWNVSPAARKFKHDGMFVSARDNFVTVLLDLGIEFKNKRYAGDVEATVRTWAEVTEVEFHVNEDGSVFVWFTFGA